MALSWLTPYAIGEKTWNYQQISKYDKKEIYPLLLQAAGKFKDKKYLAYMKNIDNGSNDVMVDLLYGK
jgi:hypothetical protein